MTVEVKVLEIHRRKHIGPKAVEDILRDVLSEGYSIVGQSEENNTLTYTLVRYNAKVMLGAGLLDLRELVH